MSVALELRGVTLAPCLGSPPVLSGLDATFEAGRVHVIAGVNGVGKSTLLRALAGLLVPTAGAILVHGQGAPASLTGLDAITRSRLVAAHLEAPHDLLGFDVASLVAMGRHGLAGPVCGGADARAVSEALARFELGAFASRTLAQLSAGQQQRVSLARTWVRGTPILLLDEPAAHLDLRHTMSLAASLREAAEAGRTVVAVVHDLTLVARLADRVLLLSEGRRAAFGRPAEVLTAEAIGDAWGVEATVAEVGGRLTVDVLGLRSPRA